MKRDVRVELVMTKEEKRGLELVAAEEGRSMGDMLRRLVWKEVVERGLEKRVEEVASG